MKIDQRFATIGCVERFARIVGQCVVNGYDALFGNLHDGLPGFGFDVRMRDGIDRNSTVLWRLIAGRGLFSSASPAASWALGALASALIASTTLALTAHGF